MNTLDKRILCPERPKNKTSLRHLTWGYVIDCFTAAILDFSISPKSQKTIQINPKNNEKQQGNDKIMQKCKINSRYCS